MILILISDFMQDEIYLKNEVEYYKDFDKVIYYSIKGHHYSNERIQETDQLTFGKIDIFYKNIFDKLILLVKGLCSKYTVHEIFKLITSGKLNTQSLKRLALFAAKSELTYREIKASMRHQGLLDSEKRILFYTYRLGYTTLASIKLTRLLKCSKVVSRGHGQDIFEFRNNENYLPYREVIFDNISSIYPISKDGANYLSRYPSLQSKIHVNYLGTRDRGINSQLSQVPFVIITCSRIARIKRLELLIQALCSISDIEIKWIHYGDGDANYERELRHQAKGLSSNISYSFEGFVDNNQLLKLLKEKPLTVFVNLSESEGLPVSIMEAISVGLPIIATNVGGTSEIVQQGMNGFLLEKNFEISQLVSYIRKIHGASIHQYTAMSVKSREIWNNCFNMDDNYFDFVNQLKEF